ncbi:MAG: PAS domain-containing protein [Gemmatimonadales bacterium]|nr:PAS domain-containing protein [Gemmatimonadales bacterium]
MAELSPISIDDPLVDYAHERPELIAQIRRLVNELTVLRSEIDELQQRRSADTAVNDLTDTMRRMGEGRITDLSLAVLTWLSGQFGAVQSAIYIYNPERGLLELTARLGVAHELPELLQAGEGLTGQAYKSGRGFYTDRMRLATPAGTGLVQLMPTAVAVEPLIEQQQAFGVIEMAFIDPLDAQTLSTMRAVLDRAALILHDHLTLDRQGELLTHIRKNADRLSAQEGKLREQLELLELKNNELQKTQTALRQSNERNRQLFRSIPCIVFQYLVQPGHKHWHLVYASPQTLTLLGYEPERWCDEMNRHHRRMIHPDDRARFVTEVRTTIERRDRGRVEVRLANREGTWRWFRIEANTYQEQPGEVLAYGVIYDIHTDRTELDQLQHEIRRLRASEAGLLNRLRGRMQSVGETTV